MTLVMATLVSESCMVVFGSIIPINEPKKKNLWRRFDSFKENRIEFESGSSFSVPCHVIDFFIVAAISVKFNCYII